MSRIQEHIGLMEVNTQILYNRAIIQLGLCAFRKGMFNECHSILNEISSFIRIREIIAQGYSKSPDKTIEQENEERKRIIPYHMHINLELLDLCYLISAMLLETPNFAVNQFDVSKNVISRAFRRVMELAEKQLFIGPPETLKENIVHAARALQVADWKKCSELLFNVKLWESINNQQQVKEFALKGIKEAALKTYLFTYCYYYATFSLEHLSKYFELSPVEIRSVVSKLILKDEIQATISADSKHIEVYGTEPKLLQSLALQLADKAVIAVENNERMLDVVGGGYGYKDKAYPYADPGQSKRPRTFNKLAPGYRARNVPQTGFKGQRPNQGGWKKQ